MFKLVAVIFAVINGAPAEKPTAVLAYNQQTFPTLEACMGFPKTKDGADVRKTIKEMVKSQKGTITAKLGCVKAEDNSI